MSARAMAGKGVVVLTYACNLRCSFCYAASEVFQHPKTMSLAEGKRSVDFLASLGIQTFTLLGGEPTVYKGLVELVAHARDLGLGPWLVTNGSRTRDAGYLEQLVAAGLKGGCVSLHGRDRDSHDAATAVPGSYDAVIETLSIAARRQWPLFPMLTVMNANVDHVMPTVRTLIDLGCTTIYINYGIPNIVPALDTGCDASPQALARLSEELFGMQRALGVRFVFNREKNKIPLCHFNHETLRDMFADEVIGTGCEAVQGNTVVIEPGGNALGCSHWVDHPLLNIYRDYATLDLLSPQEFWDQWMTGRPLAFREELKWFPYEQCGDCGWRKDGLCWGGCKVWQAAGVLPRHARYEGDGSTPWSPRSSNRTLERLLLPVLPVRE